MEPIDESKVEYYMGLVRASDFPQTYLAEKTIRSSFNALSHKDVDRYGNCCTQVIQHFHHSLWDAHRKGCKSPHDAWYDDDIMRKCVENRLKYIGDDLSLTNLRMGLTAARLAQKVSCFRPAMAKYVIGKYAVGFSEIFDPCSGYSGRLLGAKALGKSYVGQDINCITVRESNELMRHFGFRGCEVSCKDSLVEDGRYECLFTCPPYGDLENWNQDIEDLSCDEWIDICLRHYDCERYIFVVNRTDKYADFVVEEISNKSHMGNSKEYIIVIDRNRLN